MSAMSLSKSFKFPEEVINNLSVITIAGERNICIENFKAIIDYREDYLKIKTQKQVIIINGVKLVIDYYDQEEIKISGIIKKIEFEALYG